MIRLRKDLEGHIRGVVKTFGIRMSGIGQGRQLPVDKGGRCLT